MSFDGLRVDHSGLEMAADDLQQGVRAIEERLARLSGELAPLRTDWTGQAQQAYQLAQNRWTSAIEDLRLLLAQSSVAVRQANADYAAADRRGAAAFGG